jgi:hypothetical protein
MVSVAMGDFGADADNTFLRARPAMHGRRETRVADAVSRDA